MRDEALCGLNNLLELILKRCELRQMPPLHPVKDTLQLLNVHDNNITKISRNYFDGCTALIYLTLSKNKLSSFPDVSPARQTLNLLKISSNAIPAISRTIIDSTFPNLEEVYISCNEIKVVPCGMLSAWPNIHKIDIKYNMLARLNKCIFTGGNKTSKVKIYASRNHFRCDASLSWFAKLSTRNYITTTGVSLIYGIFGRVRFQDYGLIACATPVAYFGKYIKDLGEIDFSIYFANDFDVVDKH